MSAFDDIRLIHNKLITDFTALKHSNGTDLCFASVKKMYGTIPEEMPFCQLAWFNLSNENIGISHNHRVVTFEAAIGELIGGSTGVEADLNTSIDRISDIGSRVHDYLEQIPNPLYGEISGVNIYKIVLGNTELDYVDGPQGLSIRLIITFNVHITLDVKNLTVTL